MAWSWLLVLVVKCVSFFCPALIFYYFYLFYFIFHYNDWVYGSMKTVVVIYCLTYTILRL